MNEDVSRKLQQFEEEIFAIVKAEKQKADAEVQKFQSGELEKYQDVALEDSYGMIQSEVAKVESDIHKAASEKAGYYRKELFKLREKYSREVFAQAREKLCEFSAINANGDCSDEYKNFIIKTAAKLGENASILNETVIFIRKEDLPLEKEIIKAFSKLCKIVVSDEIKLGGLSVENYAEGYQEDKSLESSLEEQFQWFCDNSKMLIS